MEIKKLGKIRKGRGGWGGEGRGGVVCVQGTLNSTASSFLSATVGGPASNEQQGGGEPLLVFLSSLSTNYPISVRGWLLLLLLLHNVSRVDEDNSSQFPSKSPRVSRLLLLFFCQQRFCVVFIETRSVVLLFSFSFPWLL